MNSALSKHARGMMLTQAILDAVIREGPQTIGTLPLVVDAPEQRIRKAVENLSRRGALRVCGVVKIGPVRPHRLYEFVPRKEEN